METTVEFLLTGAVERPSMGAEGLAISDYDFSDDDEEDDDDDEGEVDAMEGKVAPELVEALREEEFMLALSRDAAFMETLSPQERKAVEYFTTRKKRRATQQPKVSSHL